LPKFHQDRCEVCGEPVTDISKLPPEIQKEIYRPGVDEVYNVEVSVEQPKGMGEDDGEEIETTTDENGRIRADLGRLLED